MEENNKYFQQRMELLGVTDELNRIGILEYDSEKRENVVKFRPIFRPSDKGIDIFVYTIDGCPINYAKEGSRWKKNEFVITRLAVPEKTKNGDVKKYHIPRGAGTWPFFPPNLVKKFQHKETIETLFLTEGYFKAFKAGMHGADVVGLSSITHYKDKDTGKLHHDIIRLIKTCQVQRVVWLLDGDCRDISSKDIEEVDLYKRPSNFFFSTIAVRDLLLDLSIDIDVWFSHCISESIKGYPKGLDDMLITAPDKINDIINDLYSFTEGKYFFKMNITHNTKKLHRYFHIHSVSDFVLEHAERRPELLEKEFTFHGTRYKWNREKQICEIVIPADASRFFRVGDQYHEKVAIPNKYNQLEHTFHRRQKQTIIDDYGKDILKFIPKYKAFCNVPDHNNWQEVIHGCYNIYGQFEHEPEEGECEITLNFLKHIFGSGKISCKLAKNGEAFEIDELDLGLDYIQLLYQKPTQILPILCLVSRENETGKSTFAKWLKLIFTSNVAIVGNSDLSNDFNASWSSKLLIICDEAKIDKHIVIEKIKSLSTADKIMMNAKGKDQIEIDFFGKFILLTNNEENFIYASEDDVRYWVRKVPTITNKIPDMEKLMVEEIPAFLNYLNKRHLKTSKMSRAWFDHNIIKTDALRKVITFSKPTIEKELREFFREKFLDFGCEQILMSRMDVHQECFRGRYEANYLAKVIQNELKAEKYCKYYYKQVQYESIQAILKHYPNAKMEDIERREVTCRYSYPKWHQVYSDGNSEMKRVEVYCQGRPYVFKPEMFLSPDEIKTMGNEEQKQLNTALPNIEKFSEPEIDF